MVERVPQRQVAVPGEFRPVRLLACPHPLSITKGRIDRNVPEGATIAGHIRALGWDPETLAAVVYVNEVLVPQAQWEYAVPREGQCICVRAIPMDSGGGDGGKTALRIVAMLAVVVAGVFTAGATASIGGTLAGFFGFGTNAAWAGAAGALVTMGGMAAINALIPPSRQLDDGMGAGAANPSFVITGTRNQLLPFGVVPQVLGRHRIYPPYAARPFTEVVGDQHYVRCLFTCGLGPLALSDLRIGQTPLSQFSDYEIAIRYGYADDKPLKGYPNDVYEDPLSIKLSEDWVQRTSQANARELVMEWTFPDGLGTFYQDNMTWAYLTATLPVQFRAVGESTWQNLAEIDPGAAATLATNFPGAHNDVVFSASEVGSLGNTIYVELVPGVVPGIVTREDRYHYQISVTLSTTAIQVVNAVNGADVGTAMGLTAALASGNDGSGIVGTFSGYLSGGRNAYNPLRVTGLSRTPFKHAVKFDVPDGQQYEVRTRQVMGTLGHPDRPYTAFYEAYWTMLRTVQADPPTTLPGQCLIYLRIRATNQLNGLLDEFNCVARTKAADWDGSDWVVRATNNPASLYRLLLQGPANARPKTDAQLDLAALQGFHERCTANGFTFNAVIDQRTNVRQLRQDILAAGRGTFDLHDTQYSVVEDLEQDIPAQVVTPRNAWDLQGVKFFVKLPHARKIRFKNEQQNWADDERVMPFDGYGVTGIDGVRRDAFGNPTAWPEATTFETADAGVGVTNPDQVFALERYQQAVALLRSESFVVRQDFEQLRCQRGDRVELNYDTILVGLGSARVRSVAVDGGGNATAVTLDAALTMVDGTTYGARFRLADGTQVLGTFVTAAGEQTSLTFATAMPAATRPQIGDLALLGELGRESLSCLVKAKQADRDFQAALTLVPYAPGVHEALTGPIPAFESALTLPAVARQTPPLPKIDYIQSDEAVLTRALDGTLESGIVIGLSYASGRYVPAVGVQVEMRLSGTSEPWRRLSFPSDTRQVMIGSVEDGATYDLRVRAIGAAGQTSEWVVAQHTVIGKTTPPPDVPVLLRDGNDLVWAYPTPPLDHDGFVLRRHFGTRTAWEDAQPIHGGVVAGTSWSLPGDLGTVTYLIKAVDVDGYESAEANWITLNLGDPVLDNLLFTSDKKAASFPGTHNGVLAGGNLEANTVGTFWSGDDALAFWSGTDSALFWVAQYDALEYVAGLIPDADKVPATLLLDLTVAAASYQVEYRISGEGLFWSGTDSNLFWSGTDSDPFWSAGGGAWLPWLGRVEQATRQVYEWRLRTAAGATKGVISQYDILVDVPDVVEYCKDVVIAATTGTRLPITKSYRGIKSVELTLVNDAGTALTATIEDYGTGGPPLTNGPLIKTRDSSRAAVAGKVSGRIVGW